MAFPGPAAGHHSLPLAMSRSETARCASDPGGRGVERWEHALEAYCGAMSAPGEAACDGNCGRGDDPAPACLAHSATTFGIRQPIRADLRRSVHRFGAPPGAFCRPRSNVQDRLGLRQIGSPATPAPDSVRFLAPARVATALVRERGG